MSPVALSSSFLRSLFKNLMSNNSGDATKALPCLEMVFTTLDDVVVLTRVFFEKVSMSQSVASTVSMAGDFPARG